jgi:PAS domain-containing protein
MGAMAIITTVLVFLLGIGLLGLIINTIFLILTLLKKKAKLFIILSTAGIIVSLIPLVISVFGISYFKSMIKETDISILDTGVKLYWEYENNNDDEEYFIYNDKKYIYLTGTGYVEDRPKSREMDKPVANIIEREKNILSRLFMFIFGIKDNKALLYTIKDYPDDSLLIEDRWGSIYCEENKYHEKINYYENIDNYKYYATYGHLPKEDESIELYNEGLIKEIYTYTGSGALIQRPPEKECNYIFIFGISNDGILIKDVASIIIYNNRLYKEFGFISEEEDKGMAILDERQSEYINKIIIDNRW